MVSIYLFLVFVKSTLFLFIIFTFIVANVNIGSDESVKTSPFLPISVTIVFHGDHFHPGVILFIYGDIFGVLVTSFLNL